MNTDHSQDGSGRTTTARRQRGTAAMPKRGATMDGLPPEQATTAAARVTAAASRPPETRAIGASRIGCSIPNRSVRRVGKPVAALT
ncbi:UNVERIFIED_CONTAM: hypothetical protein K7Z72_14400 [Mycobacterium avium subsp. hominissuis]